MTEDRMVLLELAEQDADGDFLSELGQWTLPRPMDLEAQVLCAPERTSGATIGSSSATAIGPGRWRRGSARWL